MTNRLALSVCFALLPSLLQAQAALTGVVLGDSSNQGVPGVEVVIQALNRKATTDTAGRFVLGGLAHGAHAVLVRAIGYRPVLLRAYLVSNDTLEVNVTMRKAAVELAPLEVTASAVPTGLEGFEERRLEGFGRFIDWTVLRKSEHRRFSDVLRETPGLRIEYWNQQPFLTSRTGCPMQVFLNGVISIRPPVGPDASPPPSIDHWHVSDLEAIEIYRGSSETPTVFGGTTGNCGIVVLWTRRR